MTLDVEVGLNFHQRGASQPTWHTRSADATDPRDTPVVLLQLQLLLWDYEQREGHPVTELQRCAGTKEERTVDLQHSGYSELAFLLSSHSAFVTVQGPGGRYSTSIVQPL